MLTICPSYRLGVFFIYFSFDSYYIFIIRFGAFFYFSFYSFYIDYLIRFGVSFYFPFHRDLREAQLEPPGDQHAD